MNATAVSPAGSKQRIPGVLELAVGADREMVFRELNIQAEAALGSYLDVVSLLGICPFQDLRKLTANMIDEASQFISAKVTERLGHISAKVSAAVIDSQIDPTVVMTDATIEAAGTHRRVGTIGQFKLSDVAEFSDPGPHESGMVGQDLEKDEKKRVAESLLKATRILTEKVLAALEQWKITGGEETEELAKNVVGELGDKVKAAVIGIQEAIATRIESIAQTNSQNLTHRDYLQVAFLSGYIDQLTNIAVLEESAPMTTDSVNFGAFVKARHLGPLVSWAASNGLALQQTENARKVAARTGEAPEIYQPELVALLPLLGDGMKIGYVNENTLLAVGKSEGTAYECKIQLDRDVSTDNPIKFRPVLITPRSEIREIAVGKFAWCYQWGDSRNGQPTLTFVRESKTEHISFDPRNTRKLLLSPDLSSFGVVTRGPDSTDTLKIHPVTKGPLYRATLGSIAMPPNIVVSHLFEFDEKIAWVGLDKGGKLHFSNADLNWKPRTFEGLTSYLDSTRATKIAFREDSSRLVLMQGDNGGIVSHLVTADLSSDYELTDICSIDLKQGLGDCFSFLGFASDVRLCAVQCTSDNAVRLLRLEESGELPVAAVIKLADPTERVMQVIMTPDEKAILFSKNPRVPGIIMRVYPYGELLA